MLPADIAPVSRVRPTPTVRTPPPVEPRPIPHSAARPPHGGYPPEFIHTGPNGQTYFDLGFGPTVEPPPVDRPATPVQLTPGAGQAVVDGVQYATGGREAAHTTVTLTRLADGRYAVTRSGERGVVTPQQAQVALDLLAQRGVDPRHVIFTDLGTHPATGDANPFFRDGAARDLRSDGHAQMLRPEQGWHGETRGIRVGIEAGSPAVEQWSSNGADPRNPNAWGHGGAACGGCDGVQRSFGVANSTGVQPDGPADHYGQGGRLHRGRDDRSQPAIPGLEYAGLAETPAGRATQYITGVPPHHGLYGDALPASIEPLHATGTSSGERPLVRLADEAATHPPFAPFNESPVTASGLHGNLRSARAGATASVVGTTAFALRDGRLDAHEGQQIAVDAGIGGLSAVAQDQGSRILAPVTDRLIGRPTVLAVEHLNDGGTVSRTVSNLTTRSLGLTAADLAGDGASGALRTAASRAAGGNAIGAAITAGVSAYENRDGLARGDSQAIGNVAADTTIGAGAIVASTAAGAAIGSVVPVAGTAVGAVVGLAVGTALTFGADASGLRDTLAGGYAKGVDFVKGLFG